MTSSSPVSGLACPRPREQTRTIQMAHGGGGRMTRQLVEGVFVDALSNPALNLLHDGAFLSLENGAGRMAFTTDSYVIRPLFFPGGNIGSLAVHGTVNDLAMCGAQPMALSAGFILEEGFLVDDLRRIVASMRQAAQEAGVSVVTGDTKVVDRGKGDGVYINTAGVGVIPEGIEISPLRAKPGDVVLINGPLADHGVAILSVREGLEFETTLETDSASLNGLVADLLDALGHAVHVLRDPTRGGVAAALHEIAGAAGVGVRLEEARLPLRDEVRGACEILGLDPLYVANEGKCLVVVAPEAADRALEVMRAHPRGAEAVALGEITADDAGRVVLKSRIGGERVVDLLAGEPLPRIC